MKIQMLKQDQDNTIKSKESWLLEQLKSKEQEIKQTFDLEIGKHQDQLQKQREENQRKEKELNEVIQNMKDNMTKQDYEYKLKEQQIKDQQQKLVEMKEQELLQELKRKEQEFQ